MKRIVLISVAVFILAVGGFLVVESISTPEVNGVEYSEAPDMEGQPIKGEADAQITITEFGDYKCPSCKAWDEEILPKLDKEFIQTGQVNLVYVNTLFHGQESGLAALASESVWANHPESFWAFHSGIYREQPDIQSHDDPWVTPETLIDVAHSLDSEIDLENLAIDMIEQTYVDYVQRDMALVEKYEVSQTPTIMVDNLKLEDPFNYEQLKKAIEQKLEER
ncbi:DsbA family protein [Alkalicoccobacillus murimartini]|uniref:Protein-disulfide isomerase n=1 Tax=Alkalicoccobacillus murimartini TaxID=171685 RepID=A0ABT9YIP6_9BACI|nr:thioredoxin domain-containing protein [Alkalicoccobacillus murimartini]MDQ0207581.1 protein-disulfide isomerase [Alkalicoccobacillus murimartini]